MKLSQRQKILLAFKVLVFVIMSWFITDRLFLKNDIYEQWQIFTSHFKGANIFLLLGTILLMPVNWFLESVKWRWLINSKASYVKLFKSIITGITLGFITPARSGEFIGRVLFLEEEHKAKVFYLTFVGGIAHTAVTLSGGALFVSFWSNNLFWSGVATGAAAVFLLLYFRYDLFNNFVSSVPFLEKRNFIIHNHHLPEFYVQVKVLLITIARYSVYVLQYILLQMFFGVSDDFPVLLIHNGVFFLIQAFSPLMPFLDFSFRGGIALFVFKDLTANNIAVLSAVLWAWFLNLVVPAVLGYLFILNRRTLSHVIH